MAAENIPGSATSRLAKMAAIQLAYGPCMVLVLWLPFFIIFGIMSGCIVFFCKESDRSRSESHTDVRSTITYNNSPSGDPIPERRVNMKPFFYLQTVLPDKSNLDPHVLREDAMMDHTDASDDDDSEIEGAGDDPHYSLSSKFPMSNNSLRRPTANDECSICLQSYQAGQSICLAKNTACRHVFHQDCIQPWLQNHSNCPICRCTVLYRTPS